MAGKTGENGHHTGRTCRSPFVRKVRREGILARKAQEISKNSEENTTQGLVSTVNYSLGKQNRWLMPEVIKSSANPREVVGEEMDFILVEQRGTQDDRKRRCFSVYDSRTRRTRKPRRRYGEAQSLKSEFNQPNLEFEVQYPVARWSWPVNSEVKYYREKGPSKKGSSKNRRGKWCQSHWDRLTEENEYFSEDEGYDDDVEDFDDGDDFDDDNDDLNFEKNQDHSHHTSLGDYIFKDRAKKVLKQTTDRTTRKQDKCSSFKNKAIIIDDEELAAENQRFVANAKAMNSLILSSLNSKEEDVRNGSRKNPNTKRNRALRQLAVLKEEEDKSAKTKDHAENPSADECSLKCTPENYPCCEVRLQGTEILPTELQRIWGESYTEGKSIPRMFAIDLAGLLKTSTDIDLAVLVILFELKKPVVMTSDICKVSVKLVLHNGLSELSAPLETIELIQREFLDSLHDCGSETLRVGKIINAGINSVKKNKIFQWQNSSKASVKKPFYTTDVFAEVLGYQGRSRTEKEVLVQARRELLKEGENDSEGLMMASSLVAECGVCFEDLNDNEGNLNYTKLVSCGHSFCNPCWELYLKSILNMGETDLFCPGHQCETPIDDITIMSLATSWYGKFFSWKIKRGITKNPTLKHCPSEKCPRVMQVTPCETQKPPPIREPLPVICACKSSWCFKCQEPAHWPSQCEKAQEFREQYKEYLGKRFMGGKKKKKFITSVMVKKCPTCSYPIEKFNGCHHMYCVLCKSQFCWQCLSTTVGHNYYDCKERIAKSEVKLPAVLKTKIQTLTDIALSNQNARKVSNIIAVQRRLKSMEQGLNAYYYLKTRTLKNTHQSRITSVLEGMIRQDTLTHVKNAFDFKLQAHVVLEGVAIILVKGGKHNDGTLQNDLMMLMFIMEGLGDLLKKPCSVYNEEVVSKLTDLIERGKLCIKDIKRHAKV